MLVLSASCLGGGVWADGFCMALVFVDLDDVLFPFAFAYRDWRARAGLAPIPRGVWDVYGLDETHIPGHQGCMAEFYGDTSVLAVPPIRKACEVLEPYSVEHNMVVCTNRYEVTEGAATRIWVERHIPWVREVLCLGWHPEAGGRAQKVDVAHALGASVLLDDRRENLAGLDSGILGVLVQRPGGVPSEPGALDWASVGEVLSSRLNT